MILTHVNEIKDRK